MSDVTEPPAGPSARSNTTRTLGFVASGLGLAFWAVHMVLKYWVGAPRPILLWIGLGLILLGFALRRSQA